MENLSYAARLLGARVMRQPKHCPYCGNERTERLARKKLLAELRRCPECRLQFRYPRDSAAHNARYYQSAYLDWSADKNEAFAQADNPETLREDEFAEGRRQRTALALAAKSSGTALDFGCSWGFAAGLLGEAGLAVTGFEVSRPRAEFARHKYGLDVLTDLADLRALPDKSFDLIFSSHVLEHLPDIGGTLRTLRRLVKDDGIAVFFVPNAGGEKARRLGVNWGALISKEHCLALDAAFFSNALPRLGFDPTFRSSPFERRAVSDPGRVMPGDELAGDELAGDELMMIARPV